MCDLERIVDAINVKSLDCGDIQRVTERESNRNVAIESASGIRKRASTRIASTLESVNIFVTENRTRSVVDTLTLLEEWSIVKNWFDG